MRFAIDDFCADAWCEGFYTFDFFAVNFDPSKRQTEVDYNLSLELPVESTVVPKVLRLHCIIENFESPEQILTNGLTLQPDFTRQLDQCINRAQDEVSLSN